MTGYHPADDGWRELNEWPLPGQIAQFWSRRVEETWHYGILTDASHANGNGVVHGGVLMTVADHALSFLAWNAAERQPCTTIQLNTHFLDAIHPGEFVEVRGQITRRTRGLVFVRGDVLAHGTIPAPAGGQRSASAADETSPNGSRLSGLQPRPVGAVDGIWRVLRRPQ